MSKLVLEPPFVISPRLLPALKIGDAFISIDFKGKKNNFYIDSKSFDEYSDFINTPAMGRHSLQDVFASLLSFLSAGAEAYRYSMRGRKSENFDLFPEPVLEWAYQHSDEIQMLELELEENPNLLTLE